MIIGRGAIASVLTDHSDRIYFASGVSDSSETRESEFKRERDLLLSQNRNRYLVYFSSFCVFYSHTPYAEHKRRMEEIIKTNFDRYTIFRLGNITWGDNPRTLLNFLRNSYLNGLEPVIEDTYRYLVDKDEFLYWLGMIPDFNCEMNVPGRRLKVKDIAYGIKERIGKAV